MTDTWRDPYSCFDQQADNELAHDDAPWHAATRRYPRANRPIRVEISKVYRERLAIAERYLEIEEWAGGHAMDLLRRELDMPLVTLRSQLRWMGITGARSKSERRQVSEQRQRQRQDQWMRARERAIDLVVSSPRPEPAPPQRFPISFIPTQWDAYRTILVTRQR